jgi:RNA:NAD 2'-phosphotransferase (TPT1/KptA family)
MNKDGHLFFRSANGVRLTDHVPLDYITFPDKEAKPLKILPSILSVRMTLSPE